MTQLEALAMFSAGLLVHPPADPVVVGMRKLSEAIESDTAALRKATTTISVTPGERVDVETPSQQRKRRSKA